MATGEATSLCIPWCMNRENRPRLTTAPERPTIPNRQKVLRERRRIHQAARMNSMMSDSPSLLSPRVRSLKCTGISWTTAPSVTAWCSRATWKA